MIGLDEMNNNIACMLWRSHAIASVAEDPGGEARIYPSQRHLLCLMRNVHPNLT